nr:hypothetical protein [Sphingobium sufflavum]
MTEAPDRPAIAVRAAGVTLATAITFTSNRRRSVAMPRSAIGRLQACE